MDCGQIFKEYMSILQATYRNRQKWVRKRLADPLALGASRLQALT